LLHEAARAIELAETRQHMLLFLEARRLNFACRALNSLLERSDDLCLVGRLHVTLCRAAGRFFIGIAAIFVECQHRIDVVSRLNASTTTRCSRSGRFLHSRHTTHGPDPDPIDLRRDHLGVLLN